MIKLIKLEWKRNNVRKWIRKSFINASVELFTHMSYMVFTGVMLAGFIVGDYERGTIRLLFSYPIKRQKIMLSKILAVWIFNFTALVASKLLIYSMVLLTRSFTHIPATDIPYASGPFWVEIFLSSAAMVSISFIALLVGMKMVSSRATVVTAVIVVCFTQGNIGEYTLANSVPFYMFLFALSVVSVFLSIYNVEAKDV